MARSDRTPFSQAAARAGKDGHAGGGLGIASVMGLHLVSGPLVGTAIGYGLDRLFETGFFLFIMLFLGIIAGFRMLFADARRLQQAQERETRNDAHAD